jgi:N utilization substance protein A
MNSELIQAIEQIGREKRIDPAVIVAAVEEAFAVAARKQLHSHENLYAKFDRAASSLAIFARKTVVSEVENPDTEISLDDAKAIEPQTEVDSFVDLARETPQLGRIAAQAAKQVIYQKVKEAERENVYNEFSGRIGELINGTAKRFERGDMIVALGETEAIIPKREESRAEHYNIGDRIKAVIVDVDRSGKGPQVMLSRTDPRLLMKLFEMEVPEIYDGTVIIMSVARDPGDRSKIAVRSKDRDVDPVGACVGMKGSRVQAVIRELRGEKIDIVQWSDDARTFVQHALNPAQINRVGIKADAEREMEVIVPDDQLSLAIGKKGQNVRLASRLVGWKIDIKSELEKKAEVEAEFERVALAREELEMVPGLGEKIVAKLVDAGFRSVREVAMANFEELTSIPGIGEKIALKIFDACSENADWIEAKVAERQAQEAARRAEEEARKAALEAEQRAVAEESERLVREADEALRADLSDNDLSQAGSGSSPSGDAGAADEANPSQNAIDVEVAPEDASSGPTPGQGN